MRRFFCGCHRCLPILLIGALCCAPALPAGAAPGDPNAAPTGTAAGEMPPASLLKAIATLLSTSRFCSDPFDQSAQPVIDTPFGDALRSDESKLVTRKDGREVVTPWAGMAPEIFFALADRLIAADAIGDRDTLLVYALNHRLVKLARQLFDQLQQQCDSGQKVLQEEQQNVMNNGGWNEATAASMQERWMRLNRMRQVLQRRQSAVKAMEALVASGGVAPDPKKPRTVEDIAVAFPDDGTITLPVQADAGVQAGKNKDLHLGKAAIVEVKDYEDTDEWGWVLQRVYLRFNIQQLRGHKITGAWLAVYGNLGDGDKPVTVDVKPLTAEQAGWQENKMTWNTQPDVKTDPIGQLIFTYGNTEKRDSEGRWYISGDMRTWLEKEVAGTATDVGLQLTTTIKEEACIFTKEHKNRAKTAPRLIVTTEPLPEQGTILDNLDR
ncbi:MAG TPA: DNRLRE domain-containing protein [Planctomycetota bacterium]|nr:DNRLRE domain-containing protein [Planctomycetota bacterium]